jgi:hypothetical protein
MKKIARATASKPPVVIPVIVVAVAVDFALIVPPVERDIGLCELPSVAPPLDVSWGCILFGIFKSTSNSHQVSSF